MSITSLSLSRVAGYLAAPFKGRPSIENLHRCELPRPPGTPPKKFVQEANKALIQYRLPYIIAYVVADKLSSFYDAQDYHAQVRQKKRLFKSDEENPKEIQAHYFIAIKHVPNQTTVNLEYLGALLKYDPNDPKYGPKQDIWQYVKACSTEDSYDVLKAIKSQVPRRIAVFERNRTQTLLDLALQPLRGTVDDFPPNDLFALEWLSKYESDPIKKREYQAEYNRKISQMRQRVVTQTKALFANIKSGVYSLFTTLRNVVTAPFSVSRDLTKKQAVIQCVKCVTTCASVCYLLYPYAFYADVALNIAGLCLWARKQQAGDLSPQSKNLFDKLFRNAPRPVMYGNSVGVALGIAAAQNFSLGWRQLALWSVHLLAREHHVRQVKNQRA